jgi:hypothetical protein
MLEQIQLVAQRDGPVFALAYARQSLRVYRQCARPQRDGKKHFAHAVPFRPHFVRAILTLRRVVRAPAEYQLEGPSTLS